MSFGEDGLMFQDKFKISRILHEDPFGQGGHRNFKSLQAVPFLTRNKPFKERISRLKKLDRISQERKSIRGPTSVRHKSTL